MAVATIMVAAMVTATYDNGSGNYGGGSNSNSSGNDSSSDNYRQQW